MKLLYIFLPALVLVVFTACGGGSSSNNTSSSTQAGAQNSSASQSSSEAGSNSSVASAGSAPAKTVKSLAAASSFLSQGLTTGLLDSFTSLQGVATGAPKLRATSFSVCSSGSASLDYSADFSSMTLIFNQCVSETSSMDGTMSIANLTSSNPSYTFTNFTMTTPEGTIYFNATISATTVLSGSTLTSYSVSINGEVTVTKDSVVNRVVFTNYQADYQNNQMTVNGTIGIDNTPEVCNSNGTYIVSTVTPITYDTSGNITGGAIKIDGDIYTFHADGTVSVNGKTYSLDELESTCIG